MPDSERGLSERVSSLETLVSSLHSDVTEFKGLLNKISDSVSNKSQTNWGLVFAGLAVLGSLWAAAIHPLTADIDRIRTDAADLARAVIVQNDKIAITDTRTVKLDSQLVSVVSAAQHIEDYGSPVHERRVSLLESNVKTMEHDIERFRTEGIPTIDKRVTLLEYRLGLNEKAK